MSNADDANKPVLAVAEEKPKEIPAVTAQSIPESLRDTALGTWLLETAHPAFHHALETANKPAPDRTPYVFKYESRAAIIALLNELDKLLMDLNDPQATRDAHLIKALLLFHRGMNHIDTEETGEGERCLTKALEDLQEHGGRSHASNLYVSCANQLGIVWAGRREFNKAFQFLQDADQVYEDLTKNNPMTSSPMLDEILPFKSREARTTAFESAHTHTMFYLAQCYGHLGEPAKSAEYCQRTLQRQIVAKEYDVMEWAINCAAMSQYYITQNNFAQALYCLAASSVMAESGPKETEDEQQKHADISLCWVKYFTNLLTTSKEVLQGAPPPDVANNKAIITFAIEGTEKYTKGVPTEIARSFDQAKDIFLGGQQWIKKAQEFYTIDGHTSDYTSTVQDMSNLYRCLTFFDSEPDRCCKLHKRRIDMLEEVVSHLNPQYFLLINRQFHYEIAECYTEMMEQKYLLLERGKEPTPHAVEKINKLIASAMASFNKFFACLADKEGKLPDKFEDTVEKAVLTAHFWMARLYTKIIVDKPTEHAKNLMKSISEYQCIVDYGNKHPDLAVFQEELKLSREMVVLLPQKIRTVLASK